MSGQLIFFRKNAADYENSNVTVTASQDAGDTATLMLTRSNRTGWGTSGSVDSDNTNFVVDFGDVVTIDSVLLINHNFKTFQIQYWDSNSSTYFTLKSVSNVTDTTSYYAVTPVLTTKLKVIITHTQTVDVDKYLSQFIATTLLGQLSGWPVIKNPIIGRNLQERKMLSGKSRITQNVGAYSVTLTVQNWNSSADLAVVESLYNSPEGFLFWPCGSSQTQFSSVRQGYTLQDIFLMRCKNEFKPEFYGGFYQSGMNIQIDLVEVNT